MNYTEFKKKASLDYLGLPAELILAAAAIGAGTLGGMTMNTTMPVVDKDKPLKKRMLIGAGKGALAGAGVAAGSFLGRNAIIAAAKNGLI